MSKIRFAFCLAFFLFMGAPPIAQANQNANWLDACSTDDGSAALVKAAMRDKSVSTDNWSEGPKLNTLDLGKLTKGTAIATFLGGAYHGHSALFLEYAPHNPFDEKDPDGAGIVVFEQYNGPGGSPHKSFYPFHFSSLAHPWNDANLYSVILHQKGK